MPDISWSSQTLLAFVLVHLLECHPCVFEWVHFCHFRVLHQRWEAGRVITGGILECCDVSIEFTDRVERVTVVLSSSSESVLDLDSVILSNTHVGHRECWVYRLVFCRQVEVICSAVG